MNVRYRSVGMSIFLSIITCGIYAIYWYVCLTDDVSEATGEYGTSGGMVLLFTIITCGLYSIYWSYKMGERLDGARFRNGVPTGSLSVLYLVLSIFGLDIINWALIQSEVNRYATGYGD